MIKLWFWFWIVVACGAFLIMASAIVFVFDSSDPKMIDYVAITFLIPMLCALVGGIPILFDDD